MAPTILPWSALSDLEPVAHMMATAVTDLRAELSGFPQGVAGVALVEREAVLAVGLGVWCDIPRNGVALLARVSVADPTDIPAALALVSDFEASAVHAGATAVEVSVRHAPGLGDALGERGYRASDVVLRLRATTRVRPDTLPTGVRESEFTPLQLDALLKVWNASFAGVPFTSPLTREVLARRVTDPSFEPGLVRIIWDDLGPLAFLFGVFLADGSGEVEMIGVLERGRGRGLGRWLLRRCAELLRAQGATDVVLRVAGSNAPALALYRAEGWAEVGRSEVWRRGL